MKLFSILFIISEFKTPMEYDLSACGIHQEIRWYTSVLARMGKREEIGIFIHSGREYQLLSSLRRAT